MVAINQPWPRAPIWRSEAHLPPSRRSNGFVRYLAKPRRKLMGWIILIGCIILNETRGVYMAAAFLKAWTQS